MGERHDTERPFFASPAEELAYVEQQMERANEEMIQRQLLKNPPSTGTPLVDFMYQNNKADEVVSYLADTAEDPKIRDIAKIIAPGLRYTKVRPETEVDNYSGVYKYKPFAKYLSDKLYQEPTVLHNLIKINLPMIKLRTLMEQDRVPTSGTMQDAIKKVLPDDKVYKKELENTLLHEALHGFFDNNLGDWDFTSIARALRNPRVVAGETEPREGMSRSRAFEIASDVQKASLQAAEVIHDNYKKAEKKGPAELKKFTEKTGIDDTVLNRINTASHAFIYSLIDPKIREILSKEKIKVSLSSRDGGLDRYLQEYSTKRRPFPFSETSYERELKKQAKSYKKAEVPFLDFVDVIAQPLLKSTLFEAQAKVPLPPRKPPVSQQYNKGGSVYNKGIGRLVYKLQDGGGSPPDDPNKRRNLPTVQDRGRFKTPKIDLGSILKTGGRVLTRLNPLFDLLQSKQLADATLKEENIANDNTKEPELLGNIEERYGDLPMGYVDYKDQESKVVRMTPQEYIDKALEMANQPPYSEQEYAEPYAKEDLITEEKLLAPRYDDRLEEVRQKMQDILSGKRTEPLDAGYLDYKEGSQEGLRRAMAARELNVDSIPVVEIRETRTPGELRTARQYKMGFDDLDFYHGTLQGDIEAFEGPESPRLENILNEPQTFSDLKQKRYSQTGYHGPGIYMTTDPEEASEQYANPQGDDVVLKREQIKDIVLREMGAEPAQGTKGLKAEDRFPTASENLMRLADRKADELMGTSPTVFRLKTRPNNVVTVHGPRVSNELAQQFPETTLRRQNLKNSIGIALRDISQELQYTKDKGKFNFQSVLNKIMNEIDLFVEEENGSEVVSSGDVEEVLRTLDEPFVFPEQLVQNVYTIMGYDAVDLVEPSFKLNENKPVVHRVIFDPEKVRSAFAKFDPLKKDEPGLSMKKGGVVPRETRPTVFATGIPTALRKGM